MIVVVMGVAGSGKSTVAKTLARKVEMEYEDADSFHSAKNLEKMRSGQPLTDEDRQPWLNSLQQSIQEWIASGRSVALACSALKKSYREQLMVDPAQVKIAYLKGSYPLFYSRLQRRKKHFMSAEMLESQFKALEEPEPDEAIICDASKSIPQILNQILKGIS
jgi:gluconokinase